MALVQLKGFDSFDHLLQLQERLARLGENPGLGLSLGPWRPNVFPALNAFTEKDGTLVVRAEVPGIKAEDVTLTAEQGRLTISGERKAEQPDKAAWHRRERGFGKFSRSLTLPNDVDPASATARCQNGVLEVRIGKRAEAKPRLIAVERA